LSSHPKNLSFFIKGERGQFKSIISSRVLKIATFHIFGS
jgi:adenylate kinase